MDMTSLLGPKGFQGGALLDALPDPIFVKDHFHRWVYVNQALCQMMGMSASELLGRTEEDFLPLETCQIYWREDDRVLATGEDCHKEENRIENNGVIRHLLTKKSRIEVEGQTYVFGILRDITEVAHTNRLLHLGEIAASLSHELMTPLTVMDFQLKSYAEKLSKGSMSAEDTGKLLLSMEKSKERLLGIIKAVRAFAQGQTDIPLTPMPLATIVEEALELARPRLERYQVELQLQEVPGVKVRCRGPQLGQILVNLLNNAADAVAERPTPWVRLNFEVREQELEIHVIDCGHGIAHDVATQMMSPFFTTKPTGQGTGLGLSLASKIAREHGGILRYDDQHPNTCFKLRLPRHT